jgi:cyclopropane-fatty-acyl-phospholipid synthase
VIVRSALRRIFGYIGSKSDDTALRIEFADGSVYQTNPSKKRSEVLIRFRTRRSEWYSLLFFYEGFFESFISGDVDLEGDRPIATLAKMGHSAGRASAVGSWFRMVRNPLTEIRQRMLEWSQNNVDRAQSIRNAEFHYALPPELFRAILGDTMGYSEGLWTAGTTTLNQAKYDHYEYVCQKLQLKPGMSVLEVGAGWGYMPIYMAKRYQVDVTVYNPVRRQNDYMRERFSRHGLGEKIRIVEGDFRDIAREGGRFDRFLSIGVHEHAGYKLKQYQLWAESIAAGLKEGGVGLVSTSSWMVRQMTGVLTLKYIFPGGHVPSLPVTLTAFDRAGLTLVDVENLWPHYKRTMEEWRKNLAEKWPEIQKLDPSLYTETFRRRWAMYLEATGEAFGNSLDLSHIVFAKGRIEDDFPFLRRAREPEFSSIGGKQEPNYYV